MKFKFGFPVLLLIAFCAVLPTTAQNAAPRFEPSSCAFALPNGQNPECGNLIVPEVHSDPNGKTIQIAVAIFRSPNANKAPEPVVYLEGGPGGSVLDTAALQFDIVYGPFLADHDVILFDQRGVGRSQPALQCSETKALEDATRDQELTADEDLQKSADAIKACGARFASQGINLGAYNSAENAADVNDLRIALGYSKVNLYGISYGTRLALTIMRDHPEGVRSAVIDSVFPPQASLLDTSAQSAQRIFDLLFQSCAADTGCNAAYPNLETVFYDLVKQFNNSPITIQVPNLNIGGGPQDMVVDGDWLIHAIFETFYLTDFIPSIPENIYAIKDGDYNFLITLATLDLVQENYVYDGMYIAVQCKEEFPFENADHINELLQQARPEMRGFLRRGQLDATIFDICAAWNEGKPNPIENQAVVSDIPTLVISGEYDPITPPDYGKMAAQTLSRSFYFEFPGVGHAVIPYNKCALSIALDFLADPLTKPAAACLADVKEPVFEVPGSVTNSEVVNMIPFSNASMGISGVVPEGWKEAIAGTYTRAKNLVDQVGLAYQVIPGVTADLAASLLASQFGVVDTVGTTLQANSGLTWRLLEGNFGGAKVDLALADSNGKVLIVIFISNDDAEREALYPQVFLPAVDALKPT